MAVMIDMAVMEDRVKELELNIDAARRRQQAARGPNRDMEAAIHGLSVMVGEATKEIHSLMMAIAFK